MFKQMMVHLLLTPLYWIGAVFVPQIFSYIIAIIATGQLLLSIKYYLDFKSDQERQIAEMLHNVKGIL